MAHELSINEKGAAEMFSGNGLTPWHGLGTVVEGMLTAKEAIVAAKMDWEVVKTPVFSQNPNDAKHNEINGYFATVRKDSGAALGVVRGKYHVIQNSESFEFFDHVIDEGKAVYDTAGALFGGKRIWIMAKLKGHLFVDSRPEDITDRYVLLTKGHDGTSALMVQSVATRVVCNNTLQCALKGAKNQFTVRHAGNYKEKIEAAQKALQLVDAYYNDLQGLINILAKQKVGTKYVASFLKKLVPAGEDEKGNEVETSTRTANIRTTIGTLFESGKGNKGETRYDLLNAVTEYADHHRLVRGGTADQKPDRRFDSIMFGTGFDLKQRAVDLLIPAVLPN